MKFYGIYQGMVVQNNDPEKCGRVKIFIPGVTNTIYDNWNSVSEDKSFSFINDLSSGVLEELRSVLPWAINASPVFGGGTDVMMSGSSVKDLPKTTGPARNPYWIGNDEVEEREHSRTAGSFIIPNVGAHVFVFFISGDVGTPAFFAVNHGIHNWSDVLSSHYPTDHENSGSNEYRNMQVINTNKHYMEIIDSDGVEEIKIFSYKDNTNIVTNDDHKEVGRNKTKFVGNNDDFEVGNNRRKEIGNDENIRVGNNRNCLIVSNDTLTIQGNWNISVSGNVTMNVGGNIDMVAGGNCNIKASNINLN